MIAYFDTSALFKLYINEKGSPETEVFASRSNVVVTSALTRVEMPAALAKVQRMKWLSPDVADQTYRMFLDDWAYLSKVPISDVLLARAGGLAWDFGLRGYDPSTWLQLCTIRN